MSSVTSNYEEVLKARRMGLARTAGMLTPDHAYELMQCKCQHEDWQHGWEHCAVAACLCMGHWRGVHDAG